MVVDGESIDRISAEKSYAFDWPSSGRDHVFVPVVYEQLSASVSGKNSSTARVPDIDS